MPPITRLRPQDKPRWLQLARGYKAFYETDIPDEDYERAWQRLTIDDGVHAFGAHTPQGELIGIVHYLFHASAWSTNVCYLQDLFVDPAQRGQGGARALIERVAEEAKAHGAPRLYWLTQQGNATARALYDKLAAHKGFIRYDYPMK